MWLRRRTDQQAKYRPGLRQRLRRLRVERTHHRIGRHDRVTATALVGIAPESVGLQVTLLPRMKARPVIRAVMPHQPRIQDAWPVQPPQALPPGRARKSVLRGKRVSVSVDLDGRGIIKKKNKTKLQ